MTTRRVGTVCGIVVWLFTLAPTGAAQDAPPPLERVAPAPISADLTVPPSTAAEPTPLVTADSSSDHDEPYESLFRPVFDSKTLLWFGGLLWLVLAIDPRRILSMRTLDVLLIVSLAGLMLLRNDERPAQFFGASVSYAFIGWTGIFVVGAYLTVRMLVRFLHREPRATAWPGIGRTAWLLLAFVIASSLCAAPLTPVGSDGVQAVRGGEHLRTTGVLPYGVMAGPTTAGPLEYWLHAAAARADVPANVREAATLDRMRWIAAIAHVLTLLGIVVLARRYNAAAAGALLAALYGLLPPVVAQMTTATTTVPAALVVWALVLVTSPWRAAGGLAGGAVLAVASGASIAPVLLAPAWLGFTLRRPRPQARPDAPVRRVGRVASVLGFLLGLLIVGTLIDVYTWRHSRPAMPRPDGLVRFLGRQPDYELSDVDGHWRLARLAEPDAADAGAPAHLGDRLIAWLVRDGSVNEPIVLTQYRLSQLLTSDDVEQPTTVLEEDGPIQLWRIRPADEAAARLLADVYDAERVIYPWYRGGVAAARTVLEAMWFAPGPGAATASPTDTTTTHGGATVAVAPRPEPPASSAWWQWAQRKRDVYAGVSTRPGSLLSTNLDALDTAHRYTFVAYAGIAFGLFLVFVVFGSRCTPWHVYAASGAVMTAWGLWQPSGGGAILAAYLPLVLVALLMGRRPDPPAAAGPADVSTARARLTSGGWRPLES